jgi:hypothetical protein
MRALCLGLATGGLATGLLAAQPAMAQSRWLESGRLGASEIKTLCERISDLRNLAHMQMISSGDERWRHLSRQELVVEASIMGVSPLDPNRCYIVMRAGPAEEGERRAFEVRDFAVSTERTSVFVVGQAYDPPSAEAHHDQ